LKERRSKAKNLLIRAFIRKDSVPKIIASGEENENILKEHCFNKWRLISSHFSVIKSIIPMKSIKSKNKSSSRSLSFSNSGKGVAPTNERPIRNKKLFDAVVRHITRDGNFNPEDMLNKYFNKWKSINGEKKTKT